MEKPVYALVLLEDERKEERIQLSRTGITLGRMKDNEIVLDNASVSRHHAVFHLAENRLLIEDLGSTGGTVVNEQPIEPKNMVELHHADLVTFGDYRTQVLALDEYDVMYDDDSKTVFMDQITPEMQQQLRDIARQEAAHDEEAAALPTPSPPPASPPEPPPVYAPPVRDRTNFWLSVVVVVLALIAVGLLLYKLLFR